MAPKPIPGLAATQRQDAESGLYLAALAIVSLFALVAGPRLAAWVSTGPNRGALSALAALLTGALAGVVLGARGIESAAGGGPRLLLGATLIWAAAAGASLRRAGGGREWPRLLALGARERELWIAAGALTVATPLAVTDLGSLSILALVLGLVVVALSARVSLPTLRGRTGLAVDLGLVALLLLVIPDLVVIRPEDAGLSTTWPCWSWAGESRSRRVPAPSARLSSVGFSSAAAACTDLFLAHAGQREARGAYLYEPDSISRNALARAMSRSARLRSSESSSASSRACSASLSRDSSSERSMSSGRIASSTISSAELSTTCR